MLSRLPIVALQTLTSYLEARDIARLVVSGDVALNDKLRNGGALSLNLEWLEVSPMPWISGLLVRIAQLEACSISTPLRLVDCPSMEFATLPPNLISLSLRFDRLWHRLEAQNICFSTLLPSLTSLELSCNSPGLYYNTSCSSAYALGLLGSLPPSLTHLKFQPDLERSKGDTIPSSFLHLLPSTLLSLDLLFTLADTDPTAVFPPRLEQLRVPMMLLSPGTSIFSKLPPTLLKLDTFGLMQGAGHNQVLPSDIPLLPPLLTHVRTSRSFFGSVWNDNNASLLPRQLKEFVGVGDNTWTEKCLEHLPRGLEYMDRITISSPSYDIGRHVPNLKKLNIGGNWGDKLVNDLVFPSRLVDVDLPLISDEICVILPKTLEKLMAREGVLSSVGAAALSKGLRSLTVRASAIENDQVLQHLGHVEHLNWTSQGDECFKLTENFLKEVTVVGKRGWKTFAVKFTKFSVPWSSYGSFGASLSRLTNLEQLTFSPSSSSGRFGAPQLATGPWPKLSDFVFPPTLRLLILDTLSSMPSHEDLCLLPPGLQSLHLSWNCAQTCDWTDETFQTLPRSLHTLQLHSFPPRSLDEIRPHLPPYLTSCNLHGFRA